MTQGAGEPNRLFENLGNGVFHDITNSSNTGAGNFYTPGCSMGDINGDGLLDIAVANNSDWTHRLSVAIPFGLTTHNQLFVNTGSNVFSDKSLSSGIQNNAVVPQGESGRTWSVAMVDYDLDEIQILYLSMIKALYLLQMRVALIGELSS
ncbi:MAG: VCBS repeat-containing protein [Methylococcales bacterium]